MQSSGPGMCQQNCMQQSGLCYQNYHLFITSAGNPEQRELLPL